MNGINASKNSITVLLKRLLCYRYKLPDNDLIHQRTQLSHYLINAIFIIHIHGIANFF